MFERMSRGMQLARQSWRVLMLDKELLMFPLLSGVACMLVLASFAIPLWQTGFAEGVMEQRRAGGGEQDTLQQVIGALLLFAYYFVNYFVIVFFNSALIGCAIIRFKGGNPNLRDGFSVAFSLLPQIAGWAAAAATVGLVLRLIESRSEKVGQVVAGLLGMAWSMVTYFVVPVIVVERVGPVAAAKRSFQVLKKTWGESLTANFGIGFIVGLAMFLGFVPIVLGIMAISSGMLPLGIAGIVIGIGVILLVSLISSALNTIIIGALYLYASEGRIPQEFDEQTFRQAFAHK